MPRLAGADLIEDPRAIEEYLRDLLAYLEGRRTTLDWPLDLRWARSEFHRRVLQATARVPYGAAASYAGIARQIGAPSATRAVAQALRRNPVPIAVPCHRVIGGTGDLTGYAGHKVGLKQRLLAVEGVRTVARHGARAVERNRMYMAPFGALARAVQHQLRQRPRRQRSAGRQAVFGLLEAAGLAPCTTCRPDLHPLPA
jgi:methylated-DNA-[protein]-cysteine S-methyltransferase